MFTTDGIDHLMRNIVLILSITFVVPLIVAIAVTIAADLAALQTLRKGTGRQNG